MINFEGKTKLPMTVMNYDYQSHKPVKYHDNDILDVHNKQTNTITHNIYYYAFIDVQYNIKLFVFKYLFLKNLYFKHILHSF